MGIISTAVTTERRSLQHIQDTERTGCPLAFCLTTGACAQAKVTLSVFYFDAELLSTGSQRQPAFVMRFTFGSQ